MAAYLISDVTVRDPEAFQIYRTRAADSISQHGGIYLVRGGEIDPVEGTWTPRTIIVVEFPSMEQARKWYCSPEYASALEVRDRAFSRNLILVDGVGVSTQEWHSLKDDPFQPTLKQGVTHGPALHFPPS